MAAGQGSVTFAGIYLFALIKPVKPDSPLILFCIKLFEKLPYTAIFIGRPEIPVIEALHGFTNGLWTCLGLL